MLHCILYFVLCLALALFNPYDGGNIGLLVSASASLSYSKTYTFCNQTLQDGIRVSSGSFTLGDSSPSYSCLAAANAVTATPRMDVDSDSMHNIRVC
jgi:hypothetical protein